MNAGHVQVPSLVYLSLQDEFVPATVDKQKLLVLFSRMPRALIRTDEEANHNLSRPAEACARFVTEVVRFLTVHLN